MSVNKNTVSNLSIDKYTIKAQSVQTIHFNGARANYFSIINDGATSLYVGVDMMPTEKFFNMKIPATSSKLYVDAYGRPEIYIYNPSLEDVNIIITSFYADFDPSALAMSNFGLDLANISLSGEFDATGDLKTLISRISENLENKIDYTALLEGINNKNKCAVYAKDMSVSASSIFTSYCEDNRIVTSIDFLSNDGENDITLGICNILDNPDEYWTTITVKSGEVINNLSTYASAIKITCDNTTGSKVRLVFREGVDNNVTY